MKFKKIIIPVKIDKIDVISILIGIIIFLISIIPIIIRGFNFEIDYIKISTSFLSTVIIVLLITILYRLLELRDDFELIRKLPQDKELKNLIDLFVNSYQNVIESGDKIFKKRMNELIGEFKISITDLKNGHTVFEDTDRWQNFFLNIIRSLNKGDTVKATSLINIWDSDFGKKNLKENKLAIEKGVKFIRLFFIEKPEELENFKAEIKKHIEYGIDVKIINNIEQLYLPHIEDLVIAGDKYVICSEMYNGRVKRVHFFNTQIEIDRKNMLFNFLMDFSKDINEFDQFKC